MVFRRRAFEAPRGHTSTGGKRYCCRRQLMSILGLTNNLHTSYFEIVTQSLDWKCFPASKVLLYWLLFTVLSCLSHLKDDNHSVLTTFANSQSVT